MDGLYEWLSGFVQSSWVDPVCGDGKCELPFEYPSYGRFGCKARERAEPAKPPARCPEPQNPGWGANAG